MKRAVVYLALALGAAALALTLVTTTARRTYRELELASLHERRAYDMLVALRLLRQHVGEVRVGLAGYALTRDTFYLGTYRRATREFGADTTRLAALAAGLPDSAARLAPLAQAVSGYAAEMGAAMRVAEQRPHAAGAELRRARGTVLLEGVRTRIVALEDTLFAMLDSNAARVRASVRRATGSGTWTLLLGVLVILAAGGAVLAQLLARYRADVELRRLNEELESRVARRTDQLAAANQELEAFVSAAAHDLRAPLRTVDGFTKLILSEHSAQLDVTAREHLDLVRQAGARMAHLIEDLLELSHASRAALRRAPVDFSALARAVAGDLPHREPARRVTFDIAAEVTAHADPNLMRIVLENLIGNAWKYTRTRADARIEFGVTGGDGQRVYYVRDNGVGFDMAHAHKLLQPFERLHPASEFEGTGIGLTTVQRIVSRHGGEVRGEGVVGGGATISFTLGETVA